MFFHDNGMKLYMNNREIGIFTIMQKINKLFQINLWVKREITGYISTLMKNTLKIPENMTAYEMHLKLLRRKFIGVNDYIKKDVKSIN